MFFQNEIRIRNVNTINTDRKEFSTTTFSDESVLFLSDRAEGALNENEQRLPDFYIAESDRNGFLLNPKNFSLKLNSAFYEGPAVFSKNCDTIFFSRSNVVNGVLKGDSRGINNLQIFFSTLKGGDWSKPRKLPFNDIEYSCCHPAMYKDGSILIFSSDMPGGNGGMDLYMSKYENGLWSEPTNLGSSINTNKNELFPTLDQQGNLYYSSSGFNGIGKLDIYTINIFKTNSTKPVALPEPINSAYDDFGLIIDKNLNGGFFTSNRPGGFGQDDIYRFDFPIVKKLSDKTFEHRFTILDKSKEIPVPSAFLYIIEHDLREILENELHSEEISSSEDIKITLKRPKDIPWGIPAGKTDSAGVFLRNYSEGKVYHVRIVSDGYNELEYLFVANNKVRQKGATLIKLQSENRSMNIEGKITDEKSDLPVFDAEVRVLNLCENLTTIYRTDKNGKFSLNLLNTCDYKISIRQKGYEDYRLVYAKGQKEGLKSERIKLRPNGK
jgi:hypothetical protein